MQLSCLEDPSGIHGQADHTRLELLSWMVAARHTENIKKALNGIIKIDAKMY